MVWSGLGGGLSSHGVPKPCLGLVRGTYSPPSHKAAKKATLLVDPISTGGLEGFAPASLPTPSSPPMELVAEEDPPSLRGAEGFGPASLLLPPPPISSPIQVG